jgi:hypothetical protein
MWALAQLLPAPAFWFTRYLIVAPRPLFAAALVVHRRAVFIYCGAQAVARGATCFLLHVLGRSANADASGRNFALLPTQVSAVGLAPQASAWYHA